MLDTHPTKNHRIFQTLHSETKKLTFVINDIADVDSMISSVDSIIDSNKEKHELDIILIDSTTQDLNLITKDYSKYFSKIIIVKNNKNENYLESLKDLNYNTKEYIIIKSGLLISKKFFKIIYSVIFTIKESVIYFAVTAHSTKKYFSFIQLYESLMQSLLSSLINKNILHDTLMNYPALIVKSSLLSSMDTEKNIEFDIGDQAFYINSRMQLTRENSRDIPAYDLGKFRILYLFINVVFLLSIAQYVYTPNLYSLISILLKIISELVFIYSYYQSLKLKFPKVEFVIFSIVHPFCMIYNVARRELLTSR